MSCCHTGVEAEFIVTVKTSELWAALLDIRPAPVHAPAHVIKDGDTGVWAGVVREVTNILTVLVGVITLEDAVTIVTVRGHGQLPTFTADTSTICPRLLRAALI